MNTPSEHGGSDRRARLLKAGALLAVFAVILAAAAWLLSPKLTEYLLVRQLDELQERTGLNIEADSIQTTGLEGVEIHQMVITPPEDDKELVVIDELIASADLRRAARGRPAVTALEIRGVTANVKRRADGSTNLDTLLGVEAEDEEPDVDRDDFLASLDDVLEDAADRLLSHFGGVYPDLLIEDARANFIDHDDASAWPAEQVTMDRFTMSGGGDSANFATELHIESASNDGFRLPETVNIEGTARRPVVRSTVAIDVDPDIRIRNLPGLPYAELGLSAIAIPEPYTIEIHTPALDTHLRDTPHELASADRVRLQLSQWTLSPEDVSITELHVDAPRLYIEYSELGASNLQELYTVVRQPQAAAVANRAGIVGDSIAAMKDEDEDDEEAPQPPPGLFYRAVDTVANLPVERWLSEVLPRTTTITDLRLVVDDARPHKELTNPAAHFELAGDILELRHSPLRGTVEGDFQFLTRAGDDVGSADVQFTIPYRNGDWSASVEIDDLELAHLSQIAGPRVAQHLHGGRIMATMDIGNDTEMADTTRFEGILSGEMVRLYHGAIAADPIEVPEASLDVDGFYNPTMEIPTPELIDVAEEDGDDAGDTEDDEVIPPPAQGGFVVDEATARLGELEGSMGFSLYGLEEDRRPARLDLDIDLEPTELQTIVDSTPAALLGPFEGISFAGTLRWLFSLEVPLYEASQMVWDAHVELSPNFEVLYLPSEIDVYALYDEFEHTIEEEWTGRYGYGERDFSYERTVVIPEARPTPVDWFLENTTFEVEELDRIWRQRGWPPVPDWNPSLGIDRQTLESPQFWHSSIAQRDVAPLPWDDKEEEDSDSSASTFWDGWQTDSEESPQDEPELIYEDSPEAPFDYEHIPLGEEPIPIDSERYGPYVYVPLHHISPYMVRAIMTTEDTGFFTHDGFNFLAIRHSVEANLEAGRYVRGASTISMQLARNLFLDRSRVMVRKLQEVALVWLMESVADIPKERMMELYLNIIEFGPGIYGIHEASMHYFGKRPDELTIGESAWLVSIVPSPKRYHSHYDRGEITPVWKNRMRRYVRAMEARDRISESEMEEALAEEVAFYLPDDGDSLLRDDLKGADDTIDPDDIDPDDDGEAGEALDDMLLTD